MAGKDDGSSTESEDYDEEEDDDVDTNGASTERTNGASIAPSRVVRYRVQAAIRPTEATAPPFVIPWNNILALPLTCNPPMMGAFETRQDLGGEAPPTIVFVSPFATLAQSNVSTPAPTFPQVQVEQAMVAAPAPIARMFPRQRNEASRVSQDASSGRLVANEDARRVSAVTIPPPMPTEPSPTSAHPKPGPRAPMAVLPQPSASLSRPKASETPQTSVGSLNPLAPEHPSDTQTSAETPRATGMSSAVPSSRQAGSSLRCKQCRQALPRNPWAVGADVCVKCRARSHSSHATSSKRSQPDEVRCAKCDVALPSNYTPGSSSTHAECGCCGRWLRRNGWFDESEQRQSYDRRCIKCSEGWRRKRKREEAQEQEREEAEKKTRQEVCSSPELSALESEQMALHLANQEVQSICGVVRQLREENGQHITKRSRKNERKKHGRVFSRIFKQNDELRSV